MSIQGPHTGKLARTTLTSLTAARVGLSHAGHRARQLLMDEPAKAAAQRAHEEKIGRLLFSALNQLKGTALKVSQMLSMESDILPEAIRRELAKGCHQVTPLNRALVHKVFQQEFGAAPQALFAHFDPVSFAAASLGQVHHAELAGGERVAVKVQYPGIAASIGSDIAMLRGVVQTVAMMSDLLPPRALIERVMNDIESKLGEELDYEHEAGQLAWFAARLPAPQLCVPLPVASHSSKRVLTMQRLDGLHLDAWLATQPDQAQRNHYGQLLFDWFMYSVFELAHLHADPHPGNFLFMADGKLGLLDFGCTKAISPAFSGALAEVWCAALRRDEDPSGAALHRGYVALAMIAPDLPLEDFREQLLPALADMQDWQVEPFREASFDFSRKSVFPTPEWEHNKVLSRSLTGMHEELPYFDRAYMGLLHMLKRMGALVVTRNRWIA
ncbi:ABC1 kinase family protein [Janthinobacterium fluminis]|uniref:AarF/ABC1/UbiB kinase family protein n=1 Tax=Janthinobacterium fluminis TaxID=2987524 RepID=A0ABT5K1U8_9BURK|nr:AarF/ABC1/UbiB kinase family protein [Janthinobacterium fluminis]MDC8758957.1 AarF/ABC1/UbiB kinase family protein [Janthinobacterium fluminis]